jgi:hypothetical protein
MFEIRGSFWDNKFNDWYRVITINNVVTNNKLVMGKGIAKGCKERYPGVNTIFASIIKNRGYKVFVAPGKLIGFPTKYHWKEDSDLTLIEKSARELQELKERIEGNVLMPKVGCGNGGLAWEDVKPIIEPYLNERIYVIEKGEEK